MIHRKKYVCDIQKTIFILYIKYDISKKYAYMSTYLVIRYGGGQRGHTHTHTHTHTVAHTRTHTEAAKAAAKAAAIC